MAQEPHNDVENVQAKLDKFPSISHLPFSPQVHDDDTILSSALCEQALFGSSKNDDTKVTLCITEKIDGGNCCIYGGKVYARTHKHETKNAWFNTIKYDVLHSNEQLLSEPYYSRYMIFGENMTAIHSINYANLTSYIYIFNIFDCVKFKWLSIFDIYKHCKILNLPMVPILYIGNNDFKTLKDLKAWMDNEISKPSCLGSNNKQNGTICPREGFVIRIADEINVSQWSNSVCKYVRKGHIQTTNTWKNTWQKAKINSSNSEMNYDNEQIIASFGAVTEINDDENIDSIILSSQQNGNTINEQKQNGATQQKSSKKEKEHKNKKQKRIKIRPSIKTSFIVCCGLPGSGKSTFAKHLCENYARKNMWFQASTDLLGNKNAVFDFIGTTMKKGKESKMIIDNCNVTIDKRKELLNCAFNPSDAICVFFDVDKMECFKRVNQRKNHATGNLFYSAKHTNDYDYNNNYNYNYNYNYKNKNKNRNKNKNKGRPSGMKIIESWIKKFERPTVKEGFKQIYKIETLDDANRLLKNLGVATPLIVDNDVDGGINRVADKVEETEEKKNNAASAMNGEENKSVGLYDAPLARKNKSMDVDILISKLNLAVANDDSNILNVYIIGSRLWGTAVDASDYDCIVITKTKATKNNSVFISVGNSIDCYILDLNQFKYELFVKHRFLLWMVCLFSPKSSVWKQLLPIWSISSNDINVTSEEKDESTSNEKKGKKGKKGKKKSKNKNKNANKNQNKHKSNKANCNFECVFNLKEFRSYILSESEKDITKMSKFFTKEKHEKVEKTFAHCLRMIMISKTMINKLNVDPKSGTIDVGIFKNDAMNLRGSIDFALIETNVRNTVQQVKQSFDGKFECWEKQIRHQLMQF